MAITRVQSKVGSATNQASPISFTVTLDSAPTNGNLLVLGFSSESWNGEHAVSSITQTNVAWTEQVAVNGFDWCSGISIWAGVVSADADTVITVNVSGATTAYDLLATVAEYSGLLTVGFLDKTATNTGASSASTDTGTTAATTQNDELWVGATGAVGTNNIDQSAPTNSFSLIGGTSISFTGVYGSLGFLEKIVSGTGAANSGTTLANSNNWGGCIATFKAASAGGPTVLKGGSVAFTMMQMINNRMLYSACKFPSFKPRMVI